MRRRGEGVVLASSRTDFSVHRFHQTVVRHNAEKAENWFWPVTWNHAMMGGRSRECLKTQIISDFFHAMCWGVSQNTKYHFLLLVRVVWCGGKLFQISSMPCAGGHYKAQSFVDDHLFLLICAHSKDAFRDFQTHTSHFCFAFEHLSLYIQKPVSGSLW